MPVKWACDAFSISETCYRYEAKLQTENDEIADWLSMSETERLYMMDVVLPAREARLAEGKTPQDVSA